MRFLSLIVCFSLLLTLSSCSSLRITSSGSPPDAPSVHDHSISEQLSRVGIAGCQRVRAYTINSGDKYPKYNQSGIMDGHLNPSRLPKDGVELSSAQIAHFLRATATTEHPGSHLKCFYPHHALVFFAAGDKIIGHYTICFQCAVYRSSVGQFVSEPDFDDLHRLIDSISLPKP
jgi:hypothetical protein